MFVLIAIYIVALLASLGRFAFLGPDEPRYAQVAREMFESGDYISPRLCHLLWFEKPALFYWLAAAAYHVFGANEFAARLPSALAALGTALSLWFAGRRIGQERLGAFSGIVLATSAIWLGFSHAATTDMLLAATMSGALVSAFLSMHSEGRTRLGFILLSAAFVGLAMLAKGLVGILLVGLILGAHGVLTRRWVFRKPWEFLAAFAVFAAVAATWYVPVTLRHGDQFIQEFFVNHHFKRYLTNKYQHPQSKFFYFLVAFGGVLPWSFFTFPALAKIAALRPRENARDSFIALAWLWFLAPIAFFTLSTSKLPGYILPAFPAFAIILASQVERLWNGDRSQLLVGAAALNAIVLTVVGAALDYYLVKKGLSLPGGAVSLALPVLFGIVGLGALMVKGKARGAVWAPALFVVGLTVMSNALLPQLSNKMGDRDISTRVASLLRADEDIVFYKLKKDYAYTFYANGRIAFYKGGRIIQGMSTGDDLDIENRHELQEALETERLENEHSIVFVTQTKWRSHFQPNRQFVATLIAEEGDTLAYRVSLHPPA